MNGFGFRRGRAHGISQAVRDLVIGVLIAGWAPSLSGAETVTVIRDDFEDNSLEQQRLEDLRWIANHHVGDLEIMQFETGDILDKEHAMRFSAAQHAGVMVGVMKEDTVATLGPESEDLVQLSFDFTFLGPAAERVDLRTGLYNDRGTPASGNSTSAMGDDFGYRVDFRQSGGSCWVTKECGDGGSLGGGTDRSKLSGAILQRIPPLGTNRHRFQLTLTRIPEGIGFTVEIDGETIVRALDDGVSHGDTPEQQALIESFSEIAIASSYPNTNGVLVDNVTITLTPQDEAMVAELTKRPEEQAPLIPGGRIVAFLAAGSVLIACTVFWVFVFLPQRKES